MPFTIHADPHAQNLAMASVGIFVDYNKEMV